LPSRAASRCSRSEARPWLSRSRYKLARVLAKEERKYEEASIVVNGCPCSDSAAQNTDSAKQPTSFSAKVAVNGKTLIADKDNKIWLVTNPETLIGIEGHHVKVKVFADSNRVGEHHH
jgi:hypothetical protein